MNSKIPINVTIGHGSLSLPASPIFQKETMIVKFLKHLLCWFLPECSRCGGVMLYDNTHSLHDKWHFVCDTCGREKWGAL